MRHRKGGRKLGRSSSHRQAMLRNMATSLLDHERIQTTDAKAKELRRIVERMITLGKRGDLHARRQALSVIQSKDVTAKLFDELADRFRERPGGYTRILKCGYRAGDSALMAYVELVDREPATDELEALDASDTTEENSQEEALTSNEEEEQRA